jgi:ribosomal protein S18 acetylase RimI-like enzyme
MHTRYVDGLVVRPLRNGDTDTVEALFARLGARSREQRFCGPKPRLSETELSAFARVDRDHHAIAGYVQGDPRPAGMARLVRAGATAEVAFEVADVYQGRGIGSILARELAADARAAGITTLTATVCGENSRVVSLLKQVAHSIEMSWRGRERDFVIGLEG